MAGAEAFPRILHVIPQDAWGGVETAARSAVQAEPARCALTVMFLAGRTVAKNRARIIDHPTRSLNSISTYLAGVRAILRGKPDVVICSLWRAVLVGVTVKLLRPRTRFVYFLHNTKAEHLPDHIAHWLAVPLADEVWADSLATLDARLPARKRATRVISFLTEHRSRLAIELSPRFVSWTRLHPQKGHDRAIQVIAELVRTGVDASLEIWGADNGEGANLRRLSESLGVEEHIRYPGAFAPEKVESLAAGHAFYLQLSRYEGMAMAVVEAMQLGLVPIVTAVGQMACYIRDGVNGLIVDADDPATTAQRIRQLLASPADFDAMSKAAAATWNDHSLYAEDICKAAVALANGKED